MKIIIIFVQFLFLKLTEENIRLLEFQSRLQDDHAEQFLNESVGDTLYKLIHKVIPDFLFAHTKTWNCQYWKYGISESLLLSNFTLQMIPNNQLNYIFVHKGYYKRADQLKKEFAIPDIRFWWTKIHALGASHAWKELETFSKSKKSPIGYEVG